MTQTKKDDQLSMKQTPIEIGDQWVEASAPSNIALIKYMGKVSGHTSELKKSDSAQSVSQKNKPTNSSLSWTLEHLRTFVRIKKNSSLEIDQWRPLVRDKLLDINLSEIGLKKFLDFFSELKREFKLSGFFEIESANTFPSDAGLASSASSYAALTLVCHELYVLTPGKAPYTAKELAKISQRGSGSSCRSFFKNWALWHQTGSEGIILPFENLGHLVVLCDDKPKTVSSSQAHLRVVTSDLFAGRPERADNRLQSLISALRGNKWDHAFQICWAEFWDMHNLFHTANPPFMYMSELTMRALNSLLKFWQEHGDGPLITMDAGSHIHLLFRQDQKELKENIFKAFSPYYKMWSDET